GVQAHDAGALEELGAPREHAALGRREVFGGVEAERGGVAVRADRAAAVLRGERVGRVLDYGEPPRPRELTDPVERDGVAGVMHGKYGLGAAGDGRLDQGRIEIQGVRLDI